MGRLKRGPMSESIQQLRSERQYFNDLVVLEAERIVLNAMAAIQYARGFSYLEVTAAPVMPLDDNCYLPPDMLSYEERGAIGLQRDIRAHRLVKEFGEDNVWLGPDATGKPAIPGLTAAEQRGFWVRFSGDLD
jgi:hypothetical protein